MWDQVALWEGRLRKAAEATLKPEREIDEMNRAGLAQIYERLVEKGRIAEFHPGVARFTVDNLKPQLRTLLDQRIMMSANLIKRHRKTAIDATLQRFAGWASSVPPGGTSQGQKAKLKMKSELEGRSQSLPFETDVASLTNQHKWLPQYQ